MADDRGFSPDVPPPSRNVPEVGRGEGDYGPNVSFSSSSVPGLVRAAGIIWIIFGFVVLLNAAVGLFLTNSSTAAGGAQGAGGGLCGAVLPVLFGIVFIHVGLQSRNGTAKDTLGNGIGSIVIGLLNAGLGGFAILGALALSTLGASKAQQVATTPMVMNDLFLLLIITGVVSIIAGTGLIVAGILALLGRTAYKAYRRELKFQQQANV